MFCRAFLLPSHFVLSLSRSRTQLSGLRSQAGLIVVFFSKSHTMGSACPPAGFTPLGETALFKPLDLGKLHLKHRIVQVNQRSLE